METNPAQPELLPCPFLKHYKFSIPTLKEDGGWFYECSDCGAQGPRSQNEAAAAEAWNTRAQSSTKGGDAVMNEASPPFMNSPVEESKPQDGAQSTRMSDGLSAASTEAIMEEFKPASRETLGVLNKMLEEDAVSQPQPPATDAHRDGAVGIVNPIIDLADDFFESGKAFTAFKEWDDLKQRDFLNCLRFIAEKHEDEVEELREKLRLSNEAYDALRPASEKWAAEITTLKTSLAKAEDDKQREANNVDALKTGIVIREKERNKAQAAVAELRGHLNRAVDSLLMQFDGIYGQGSLIDDLVKALSSTELGRDWVHVPEEKIKRIMLKIVYHTPPIDQLPALEADEIVSEILRSELTTKGN